MTELQLSYFLKVAETMSYSKAAKELYVTQPTVSAQISSLENELKFKLFDRSVKNKITLTPSGRVFLEGAKKSRQLLANAVRVAESLENNMVQTTRIGFCEGWHLNHLMEETRKTIAAHWNNEEVQFASYPFKDLRQRLKNDELDIILIMESCMSTIQGVEVERIAEIPAYMYFSKSHRFADKGNPVRQDFENEPFYILPSDEIPLSNDVTHGFFFSRQMKPEQIVLPNRDTILMHIESGWGYAVFDGLMNYYKYRQLERLELDSTLTLCAAKKTMTNGPVIDMFYDTVKRLAKEGTLCEVK